MNGKHVELLMTSGRTLNQGRGLEKGKTSQEYMDAVAICEMDAKSMDMLGLESGNLVLVRSDHGETVVKCRLDRNLESGIAFMPYGPYFNALLGADTQESGMPRFKTLRVSVRVAQGRDIPSIRELLDDTSRGG